MEISEGLKRKLLIAFRSLAGLFMLVVVAGAGCWAWSSWKNTQLERLASATKKWKCFHFGVP